MLCIDATLLSPLQGCRFSEFELAEELKNAFANYKEQPERSGAWAEYAAFRQETRDWSARDISEPVREKLRKPTNEA